MLIVVFINLHKQYDIVIILMITMHSILVILIIATSIVLHTRLKYSTIATVVVAYTS